MAALFLPLTALSGLFSMYVRADVADTTQNFWYITSAGVLAGLVMCVFTVARR